MTASAMLSLALIGCLVALPLLKPSGLMTLSFLLWSVNMMPVFSHVGSLGPVLAVPVVLVALVKQSRTGGQGSPPRNAAPIAYYPLVVGLIGIALSPTAISIDAVWTGIQVAVLGLLTILTSRTIPGALMVGAAFRALSILVIASVAAGIAGQGVSTSGRWLGVTENPNSLGLMVGLWGVLSIGRGRLATAAVPASLVIIGLAASRGAMLSALVGLGAAVWVGAERRPGTRALIIATMTSAALGGALLLAEGASDESAGSLVRVGDSGRLEAITGAWGLIWERPLTGFGIGTGAVGEIGGAHFFPVTLGVQLGVVGLGLFTALVVGLLKTRWRRVPGLAGLVFFALTSVLTESWLFGAGAVWTVAFWFATSGLDTDARTQLASSGADLGRRRHASYAVDPVPVTRRVRWA